MLRVKLWLKTVSTPNVQQHNCWWPRVMKKSENWTFLAVTDGCALPLVDVLQDARHAKQPTSEGNSSSKLCHFCLYNLGNPLEIWFYILIWALCFGVSVSFFLLFSLNFAAYLCFGTTEKCLLPLTTEWNIYHSSVPKELSVTHFSQLQPVMLTWPSHVHP